MPPEELEEVQACRRLPLSAGDGEGADVQPLEDVTAAFAQVDHEAPETKIFLEL